VLYASFDFLAFLLNYFTTSKENDKPNTGLHHSTTL